MQREGGSWPKAKDRRTWPQEGENKQQPAPVKRRKSVAAAGAHDAALVVKSPKARRKSSANINHNHNHNHNSSIVAAPQNGSPVLRSGRSLTGEEEAVLVEMAQEAMRRHPGCLVSALKRNPRKRAFGSTNRAGMSIVTHHILVGSGDNAQDLKTLKRYGVTHILNVAVKLPNYYPDKLAYLKIELTDSVDCDILPHRQKAYDFLQRVETLNGRVLVHCVAGVSRSVTIVLMYLIERHSLRLRNAWEYMLSVRPFIAPNEGFRLQLAKLELSTFGESSIANYRAKEWDFYEWNHIKTSCQRYEEPSSLCIIL